VSGACGIKGEGFIVVMERKSTKFCSRKKDLASRLGTEKLRGLLKPRLINKKKESNNKEGKY